MRRLIKPRPVAVATRHGLVLGSRASRVRRSFSSVGASADNPPALFIRSPRQARSRACAARLELR